LIEHDTVVGELTHTGKPIEHAFFLPLEIDIAKGDWLCGTVFAELRITPFARPPIPIQARLMRLLGGRLPAASALPERKIGR
jgi:hypothetical protein